MVVGAPLLFFLVLEMGLRLAHFGRNTDFYIPDESPGMYRTNPHYTELFFPASFGLKPLNYRLPKIKPAGSFRVFVLGESAAMGVPEPGFALAPQLRAQLRAVYPDKNVEVYNLGIAAINSHVILHLARQAVEFQPDLLVIYMGNNEVVGPYGPGSAVTDAMLPLWLIRASVWVRSTRTGQLLQGMLRGLNRADSGFKEWRGMEMFEGKTIEETDPRMEAVYRNFAANLDGIIKLAHRSGIKTVLSTVAVNLKDSAPFAARHTLALSDGKMQAWQEAVNRAEVAMALDDDTRARSFLEEALAIDPAYADTHFLLARIFEKRGDAAAARVHYLEALQKDVLRFRCDARLNQIIRDAAKKAGPQVVLLDAAKEMGSDANSTVGLAGHRLFFEHVHLTWEGNYLLARLMAAKAAPLLFGGETSPAPWLDSNACAEAVGYNEIGHATVLMRMNELTERPPFTRQLTFASDRTRLQREITQANEFLAGPGVLASATSRLETIQKRDPLNAFLLFQTAAAHVQRRDPARALEFSNRLAEVEPFSPEQAAQKAFILFALKQPREAEELLLHSAATDPYYFQTYGLLGNFWMAEGQQTKALAYFNQLVTQMPESVGARLTYAQVLGSSGDWQGAEQQWLSVLRSSPDNEAALSSLLDRLLARGRVEEATELMLKAYRHNSRNFRNNARLEQIFEEKGDLENTVKFMRAMADSGPVKAALYFDLALNLKKLGRTDEMLVELGLARKAAEVEEDQGLFNRSDALILQESPKGR